MTVDAIAAVASGIGTAASDIAGANLPAFSERLLAEVGATSAKLQIAETKLLDFAAGTTDNLHHVMLALEDARLSFQLLMQVRNKVLESYQEVMRMQI